MLQISARRRSRRRTRSSLTRWCAAPPCVTSPVSSARATPTSGCACLLGHWLLEYHLLILKQQKCAINDLACPSSCQTLSRLAILPAAMGSLKHPFLALQASDRDPVWLAERMMKEYEGACHLALRLQVVEHTSIWLVHTGQQSSCRLLSEGSLSADHVFNLCSCCSLSMYARRLARRHAAAAGAADAGA